MEILFRTKAESNQQQRVAFLKPAPAEHFEKFLEMMEAFELFPVKNSGKRRVEKGKRKGKFYNSNSVH